MDDPLIALTLWQNDSTTTRSKSKKPGRPRRVECPLGQGALDSNKIAEELEREEEARSKKEKARSSTSKKKEQSQQKPSGGKKSTKKGGADLDNCFPCLPGMENEKERDPCESSEHSCSPVEKEPLSGRTTPEFSNVVDSNMLMNSPVPQPQNFWLMRLFQSKLFNMSIAIGYLFNSKEADVQAYLGNKLFVSSHWGSLRKGDHMQV